MVIPPHMPPPEWFIRCAVGVVTGLVIGTLGVVIGRVIEWGLVRLVGVWLARCPDCEALVWKSAPRCRGCGVAFRGSTKIDFR